MAGSFYRANVSDAGLRAKLSEARPRANEKLSLSRESTWSTHKLGSGKQLRGVRRILGAAIELARYLKVR